MNETRGNVDMCDLNAIHVNIQTRAKALFAQWGSKDVLVWKDISDADHYPDIVKQNEWMNQEHEELMQEVKKEERILRKNKKKEKKEERKLRKNKKNEEKKEQVEETEETL